MKRIRPIIYALAGLLNLVAALTSPYGVANVILFLFAVILFAGSLDMFLNGDLHP